MPPGYTPNPTYREVCSGMTGHNEVVLVVFDPKKCRTTPLLKTFWESHDPTQGMRQGNDVGTQYRSGIYYYDDEQREAAERTRQAYQEQLTKAGHGAITTEILPAPEFYYAEDYHQQYLAKNPDGYCGLGGTGRELPGRRGGRMMCCVLGAGCYVLRLLLRADCCFGASVLGQSIVARREARAQPRPGVVMMHEL